jgi:IPT/TIG domain
VGWLAGGSLGVAYPAATLYAHAGEGGALYDVVSGSNGSCGKATACQAAPGYDGPTGVGSPIGLGAFSIPGSPASTSRPTISGVAEQGQTLTETRGGWSNSPTSIGEQWEACNPLGSGCSAIPGAIADTLLLTAAQAGSTIRVQETAANAAGRGAPAASTQTEAVPSNTPELSGFSPASGITGSAVRIEGQALGAAGGVEFGALAATFKVLSSTALEAIVPNGARKATISVTTPAGVVTSKAKFTPTLSVTSVKPLSGQVGKRVTIKGVGFNSDSTVSFGGQAASVTFVSSKKLTATVPVGAKAGPIAVVNTSAPIGTVYSAASFTP